MNELANKTAIITGASADHGIGRAIALRLAKSGANIIACDIHGKVDVGGTPRARSDMLADLVREIADHGGSALAVELDVTQADQIESCVETALNAFGQIDVLVNNAGSLSGSDTFMATTPAQWESSFRVNLLGPMMLTQAVIPHMQGNGGGRIINIGSTGSLGAEPGFGAYTAMKHGLVGLSKTIAAEFGPDGILCNTVCPGYIATDMHMAANIRLAGENGISVEQMKASRYANVALRDAGLPQDVANAVAYLAGPQANYVTGISLPVAGGVPMGL